MSPEQHKKVVTGETVTYRKLGGSDLKTAGQSYGLSESRTGMHGMQMSHASEGSSNSRSTCADPANMAERELLTFINAVTELFGSEPARFLTEVWLDELALMDNSHGLTSCDWRLVTLAASARLAVRLINIEYHQASLRAFANTKVSIDTFVQ